MSDSPRKFLRSKAAHFTPAVKSGVLKVFGERLNDEDLWHLNRRSVSGAVAVGLFCAYLPMPFEMVAAALLAVWFRVNLPIAVALVFISNPLTWMFLYGPAYFVGARLIDLAPGSLTTEHFAHLGPHFLALWLGCLIFGVLLAATGWLAVRIAWRIKVVSLWQNRRRLMKLKAPGKTPDSTD